MVCHHHTCGDSCGYDGVDVTLQTLKQNPVKACAICRGSGEIEVEGTVSSMGPGAYSNIVELKESCDACEGGGLVFINEEEYDDE